MFNAIRIYGKELERWTYDDEKGRERTYQIEYAYKEYDAETMDICNAGSEDFSLDRWNSEIEKRWVYAWDGNKRNKGGYRWFENQGYIKFRKSEKKLVKEYLRKKYNAEIIELR